MFKKRTKRSLLLYFVVIGLFANGCTTRRLRIATETAVHAHVTSLPSANPVDFVKAHPSVAWNTAYTLLRSKEFPISLAEPHSGKLLTSWAYLPLRNEPGTNSVDRVKVAVNLSRHERFGLQAQVSGTVEQKINDICAGERPWTQIGIGQKVSGSLTSQINSAIRAKVFNSGVTFEMLVFPLSPQEMAQHLAATALPYTARPVSTSSSTTVESDWRVTESVNRDVRVEVRSRFTATIIPHASGSKLLVNAVAEHRGFHDNREEYPWRPMNAGPIRVGIYGLAVRNIRPLPFELPEESARTELTPEIAEPAVPAPLDPLDSADATAIAFSRSTSPEGSVSGNHLSSLGTYDPSSLVKAPMSVALNAVGNVMRNNGYEIGSVVERQGVVESSWRYGQIQQTPGKNSLTREKLFVRSQTRRLGDYTFSAHLRFEEQSRGVCQEPSSWSMSQGVGTISSQDLVLQIQRQLEQKTRAHTVASDDLVFPPQSRALAQKLSRDLPGYETAVRRDEKGWVIESQCRITGREHGTTNQIVRSRLRIHVVHAGSGSKISVIAHAERRPAGSERGPVGWRSLDTTLLREGVFSRAAKVSQPNPVLIPDTSLPMATGYESPAPELPLPRDPLQGQYELRIVAATAPHHKPDGTNWDSGDALAQFIKVAPIVIEGGIAVYSGGTAQLADYIINRLAFKRRSSRERILQHFANYSAKIAQGTTPPDLQLVGVFRGKRLGTNVVKNTFVARYDRRPYVLHLNGMDEQFGWELWDIDLRDHDRISSGSISIDEIANACGIVCQERMGSQICFEIRR